MSGRLIPATPGAIPDEDKMLMDVSGHDNLAAVLNGVFDSQIAGGKRYDLATLGRRAANATFLNAHSADASSQLIFGIDLTPVVADETLDIRILCVVLSNASMKMSAGNSHSVWA